MERLNEYKIRLLFVGIVAAIVLGGRTARAEIIMSEPISVGPVINDAYDVQNSDFSHDGLQLYFAVWGRPDGFGSGDIYMAERETINSPWQEPVNLGPNVNSSACEIEPSISSDNLELYFSSWDDYILRVCTRPSKDASWSSPMEIGPPVGSVEPAIDVGTDDAWSPDISADGLYLYFASTRVGGYGDGDIWVTTRSTLDDPWGEPENLGPNVNTSTNEGFVTISADGLTLIFNRGFRAMYATTRKSIHDDWEPAMILPFNNPPGNFHSPTLSPDGSTLYFNVASPWGTLGKNDIWQVNFIPIVDFNSDEIVDIADLVTLIEHWGEENPLYDIGPLPLGDGMVNEADLEVLMSHWGQEAYDPALIAHWKLDETEGNVAFDSASTNDAAVLGDPVWQPEGGMVDGAIALDGTDDYLEAPFVLSPADGPFSVFAWVKGGAPGQVVLSQTDAANWLCTDAAEGSLMTGLVSQAGRSPTSPLVSQAVITDGNWHRIGVVWDSSCRHLYVDGTEVANDVTALSGLETATGGLYFGVGSSLASGTFFSGLIDDVRIYNRTVSP
jgi:hypothetical protein